MEHHESARGVQTQERSGHDATKDIQGLAKQVKGLDLKIARLERLVEDLRRRVDLLEADEVL
jgi:predicted RNase H-like nuclease (RuvC/YqgF family)